ncbi:hypothetical protein PSPO01_00211 [Paraphaeosphaeria sporulosa]
MGLDYSARLDFASDVNLQDHSNSHTDLLLAMNHPPELRSLEVSTRATKQEPRNNGAWRTLYEFGEGVKSCHGMARLDLWRYAIITSENKVNTRDTRSS